MDSYKAFRSGSKFVTGSRNGTISLWNKNKIEKSAKIFDERAIVLYKNSAIFAASENKDVVELNMNLDVVKNFHGRNSQPFTIDANENSLVVGYDGSPRRGPGYVDVHSRTELDENGTYKKIMVRNLFY